MKNLKELFESSVLTDETKDALQEAFEAEVAAAKIEAEAKFSEQLAEAQKEMSELIPQMIEEAVADHLEDLAEEIKEARSLEVVYAEKLEAFKESYDEKMSEFIALTINESVEEEFQELREDIEVAKKHQFSLKIMEAYKSVYEQMYGGVDITVYDELASTKAQLESYQRKEVMESLLEGLTGNRRKVAETILEGVATDRLEDKFNTIRPVLLAEVAKVEGEVVNEGDQSDPTKIEGTVVLEADVDLDELDEEEQEDEKDNDKAKGKKKVTESAEQRRKRALVEKSLRFINR